MQKVWPLALICSKQISAREVLEKSSLSEDTLHSEVTSVDSIYIPHFLVYLCGPNSILLK